MKKIKTLVISSLCAISVALMGGCVMQNVGELQTKAKDVVERSYRVVVEFNGVTRNFDNVLVTIKPLIDQKTYDNIANVSAKLKIGVVTLEDSLKLIGSYLGADLTQTSSLNLAVSDFDTAILVNQQSNEQLRVLLLKSAKK